MQYKNLRALREDKDIRQKEIAAYLNVSQNTYSQYETGVISLTAEVLIKLADYYNVSCDYLLGRTANKTGAMIAVDEIPEQDPAIEDKRLQAGGVLPVLNKKLIVNSLQIIFDLLQKANNKALTAEVSNGLIQTVYVVFRRLYSANPKNPQALFSVEDYMYEAAALGAVGRSVARAGRLAAGHSVEGNPGVEPEGMPAILPDDLTAQYPHFAASLLNMLRMAEKNLDA